MQLTVRLKPRSYNLIKFTAENPHVSIMDWCNFNYDFYQVQTSNADELQSSTRLFLELRRRRRMVVKKRMNVGPTTNLFVFKCNHPRKESIEEIMNKFSCLPIPPLVFQGGWLKISAICFDKDDLPPMFSRLSKLGKLEVDDKASMSPESFRKNFMIPTSAIVSNLTPRQAESILVAVERGYYRVPRKVKFDDISRDLGVPKTAYEEHVRKAEGKVINAVAPYLSLFFGRPSKSH